MVKAIVILFYLVILICSKCTEMIQNRKNMCMSILAVHVFSYYVPGAQKLEEGVTVFGTKILDGPCASVLLCIDANL